MYLLAILPQLEAGASNSQQGISSSIDRMAAGFLRLIRKATHCMNVSGGPMPQAMRSSSALGYGWIGDNGSG